MDPGEYDACTYCGKTIFHGVAECPYCHNYTDGKGPLGIGEKEPRKLTKIYVIAGCLLLLAMVLEILVQLWPALLG
jgi:hypothetical protein